MKDKSLEFLVAMIFFSVIFGFALSPFTGSIYQAGGGGIIIGYFAAVLAQIEGNTRK